jgi:transcriptional regulator with XRE-family HTH domain
MTGRALRAWNLRQLRVQRGLSQKRLAFDSGVDRSYVGGLERKEENPTLDLLDRLAKTLGVSVSELFREPRKGESRPKHGAYLPYGIPTGSTAMFASLARQCLSVGTTARRHPKDPPAGPLPPVETQIRRRKFAAVQRYRCPIRSSALPIGLHLSRRSKSSADTVARALMPMTGFVNSLTSQP